MTVCHPYRVNAKWVGWCENAWYYRIHGQELGPWQDWRTEWGKKIQPNCNFKKRWDGLKEPHSLPHIVIEHGLYVPPRAESTEAFAKTLIVDGPSVDREETHQQNQIPSPKHHPPDLKHTHFSSISFQLHFLLLFTQLITQFKSAQISLNYLIAVVP